MNPADTIVATIITTKVMLNNCPNQLLDAFHVPEPPRASSAEPCRLGRFTPRHGD